MNEIIVECPLSSLLPFLPSLSFCLYLLTRMITRADIDSFGYIALVNLHETPRWKCQSFLKKIMFTYRDAPLTMARVNLILEIPSGHF